jgi:hypothetical protein
LTVGFLERSSLTALVAVWEVLVSEGLGGDFRFQRSRLPTELVGFNARSHANLPILNRFE